MMKENLPLYLDSERELTRQLHFCDCLVNLEEKFQQNSVVPLGTNGLIRQAIASVFVCLLFVCLFFSLLLLR